MPNRRAAFLSFFAAFGLAIAASPAIAQNVGDQVSVQSGSYLSPTAYAAPAPFATSYNCFSFTSPPFQACDVETRVYTAALFASMIKPGQAIEITSHSYFTAVNTQSITFSIPNVYNVFMGLSGGALSFFGTFGAAPAVCTSAECSPVCDITPTPTCLPRSNTGLGAYVYDPALGDLTVQMVEISERAQTSGCCYWYENGEIVTQFGGTVVATPEPSTIVLLGSGLLGLYAFARRRRPKSAGGTTPG